MGKHKAITVDFKLNHDPSFVADTPSLSMSAQKKKLYELSKSEGDITLIIKTDTKETDLYSPPTKKRKRNNVSESNKNEKHDELCKGLDDEIKISSFILRSSSSVFDNMLKSKMKENTEKRIEIYAKSRKVVEDFTYWMVFHELPLYSDAFEIIKLAHLYKMDLLFGECVNKKIKGVCVLNFVRCIQLFDKYEIKKGYTTLFDFGQRHLDEIQKTDQYSQLHHSFRSLLVGE